VHQVEPAMYTDQKVPQLTTFSNDHVTALYIHLVETPASAERLQTTEFMQRYDLCLRQTMQHICIATCKCCRTLQASVLL